MKKHFLNLFFLVFFVTVYAQNNSKPPLTFAAFDIWKSLNSPQISNDGKWVSFEINHQDGDGKLFLSTPDKSFQQSVNRGKKAVFSPNSSFLAFHIYPQTDSIKQMKRAGAETDELPKDSLAIWLTKTNEILRFPRLKSFQVPEKENDWIAYLLFSEEQEEEEEDSTEEKKIVPPSGDELVIFHPESGKKFQFQYVTDYSFSENGKSIVFVQLQIDTLEKPQIVFFNILTEKSEILFKTTEVAQIESLTIDHLGNQFAFLFSSDTTEVKTFSLYFGKQNQQPKLIADTLTTSFPKGWTVSENGELYFSENDKRLFFGSAPKPEQPEEDTLLDEEKVSIDIWSWHDPLLQSQQLFDLETDLTKAYLAVFNIEKNQIFQLENEDIEYVSTTMNGNGNFALGYNYEPYKMLQSWETPEYADVFLVDLNNGNKTLIKKKIQSYITISPNGKFVVWYEYADSNYYSYNTNNKAVTNITVNCNVDFYDCKNDQPADPENYGIAGWTENDEYLLIYDRFDIWKIAPDASKQPINATNGYGRNNNIRFYRQQINEDELFINSSEIQLLNAFNETNKQAGFFEMNLKKQENPKQLVIQDYMFYFYAKAKNAPKYIWAKGSFTEYPELQISGNDFLNSNVLSETNPQQKDYNWGTAELISWNDLNGDEIDGLLYKPEDFDPSKKYPMLIYFYDRHSDELHQHYTPRPSRSVINPTCYTSNGYIVLMPDIKYTIGYPGQSACDAVISGANFMISQGYVNKEKIGIQGQSWGGYQVAYLITQTNMFAAASAGAPVTNMTSAYGGIRWESGMSRMFQYEEAQSRIGGTLWEKPWRYIENSPIFYADKVNTPLLIRHDDADGAVPWYQGIEFFVALRRLQKPVWMLNYNGQPHNLSRRADSKDLSIRMMQFFNHYLKDEPMPNWMEDGVPATQKGKTMGYEID